MRTRVILPRLLAGASVAILGVVGTAGAASAQTHSPTTSIKTTNTATESTTRGALGLELGGFNAQVAEAHGYKVTQHGDSVTETKNGVTHSFTVSALSSNKTSISPDLSIPPGAKEGQNKATNNCGTAWIGIDAIGDKQAVVTTAFQILPSVDGTVTWYDWPISVTDDDGVGNKDYYGDAGVIGGLYWDNGTGWDTTHTTLGLVFDTINGGAVILSNGDVCYAEDITAYTTLY